MSEQQQDPQRREADARRPREEGQAQREAPFPQDQTHREADLSKVRTVPVASRANKVDARDFAKPPAVDVSFTAFLNSLPHILEARSFSAVVDAIVNAKRNGRGVFCFLGGHVVKTGLAPLFIELMQRGVITHLSSNGSAVIHDYEMARWGGTSEDVEAGLTDGSFGMASETGAEMNRAIREGAQNNLGLGESLMHALARRSDNAYPDLSLLLAAHRYNVPFTVHAALGAEIIHQHPDADGGAIGQTSFTDFKRLAARLPDLEGGVVLNIGSAVIMPEVFLKALTISRNLNNGHPREFTAADFDMLRQYRPRMNVVERPTRTGGGRGYQITGHHEIMIPLLTWSVLSRL